LDGRVGVAFVDPWVIDQDFQTSALVRVANEEFAKELFTG
jgi:hypothetical protein